MIRKFAWAMLTYVTFLPSLSIGQFSDDHSEEPLSRIKINEEDYGYFLSSSEWSDKKIAVCWENPQNNYKDQMDLVMRSIEETWERYSKLDFSDKWDKCPDSFVGIRILIEDSHPHVKALGSHLDGKKNGMVLNFDFTFKDSSGNQPFSGCLSNGEGWYNLCIRSIAVHEFGHAIGFAHEHNRLDDREASCTKAPQGSDGDRELTPYDPDSVMNYCNPKYNNYGKLSYYDVISVQEIYGTPE